ncbi:hypothetical protein FKM82_017659 [Ascaphus truei]
MFRSPKGPDEEGMSAETAHFLFDLSNRNCLKKEGKHKGSKKRTSSATNHPPGAPTYDTVPDDFPVYAIVDKSKKPTKNMEENVLYAEVEAFRQPNPRSHMKTTVPKKQEATEYATLNFHRTYDGANGTLV